MTEPERRWNIEETARWTVYADTEEEALRIYRLFDPWDSVTTVEEEL